MKPLFSTIERRLITEADIKKNPIIAQTGKKPGNIGEFTIRWYVRLWRYLKSKFI